jgi:hypothetical protein
MCGIAQTYQNAHAVDRSASGGDEGFCLVPGEKLGTKQSGRSTRESCQCGLPDAHGCMVVPPGRGTNGAENGGVGNDAAPESLR